MDDTSDLLELKKCYSQLTKATRSFCLPVIESLLTKTRRNGLVYYFSLLLGTSYTQQTLEKYDVLSDLITKECYSPMFEGVFLEALSKVTNGLCDFSKLNLDHSVRTFLQHILAMHHGEFLSIPIDLNYVPSGYLLQNYFEDPNYQVPITKVTHRDGFLALRWTDPMEMTLDKIPITFPITKFVEEQKQNKKQKFDNNEMVRNVIVTTEECVNKLHEIAQLGPNIESDLFKNVEWELVFERTCTTVSFEDLDVLAPLLLRSIFGGKRIKVIKSPKKKTKNLDGIQFFQNSENFGNQKYLQKISFSLFDSFLRFVLAERKNSKSLLFLFQSYFSDPREKELKNLSHIILSEAFCTFFASREVYVKDEQRRNDLLCCVCQKFPSFCAGALSIEKKILKQLLHETTIAEEFFAIYQDFEQNEKLKICNQLEFDFYQDLEMKTKIIERTTTEFLTQLPTGTFVVEICCNKGIEVMKSVLNHEENYEAICQFLENFEKKCRNENGTKLSEQIIQELKNEKHEIEILRSGGTDEHKSDKCHGKRVGKSLREEESEFEEVLCGHVTPTEFVEKIKLEQKSDNEKDKEKAYWKILKIVEAVTTDNHSHNTIFGDLVGLILTEKMVRGVVFVHVIKSVIALLSDVTNQAICFKVIEALMQNKLLTPSMCRAIKAHCMNFPDNVVLNEVWRISLLPSVADMDHLKYVVSEDFFGLARRTEITEYLLSLSNTCAQSNLKENCCLGSRVSKIPVDLKEVVAFLFCVRRGTNDQEKVFPFVNEHKQIIFCKKCLEQIRMNTVDGIELAGGVGSWLGTLTLHQNKPVRMNVFPVINFVNEKMKRGLWEGVCVFLVSFLRRMKSSIFNVHNPWIHRMVEIVEDIKENEEEWAEEEMVCSNMFEFVVFEEKSGTRIHSSTRAFKELLDENFLTELYDFQ
ncbi:hypothetical protein EIN_206270 [Entamoeba invadens IP1]|uniref:CCR4-NOT transcription complex subunit 1 CAF1-binding domain-containing protein n=1 Tax=Entamoeba invadens IP1 TaxID=370355 RepID=A0A0A1UD19_ENTIV|nr:hypothetical protein EIN_206270 [Entamoeba invadens IP1]ELP91640.1 hypothetical protein EIN_206270 [Entamoeba invadens IP1]|eukprot:XP_004258411.1 hypothetical protein EIN_206270 [Entamoeba invadens IP1]